MKSYYEKRKSDRSLTCAILDTQFRAKDAHTMFMQKHALITSYDNLKTYYKCIIHPYI